MARKGTRTLTYIANWKLRTIEFLLENMCGRSMTNIPFLCRSQTSQKVKRQRFTFICVSSNIKRPG